MINWPHMHAATHLAPAPRLAMCRAAVACISACMLLAAAGCSSHTETTSMCTDPLASAFQLMKSGHADQVDSTYSANARELAICTTEALGKLAGYQEQTSVEGKIQQESRVNVHPLRADITISHPQAGSPEEIVMIEEFVFVKIDGQWLEATEDSENSAVRAALNLPKSLQTQFNPHLRAAGTDDSIVYSATGTDTILDTPVLILEAPITAEEGTYISRYYLDADYQLLRSEAVAQSGDVQSATSITELDEPQTISNPMLPEK